MFKSEEERRFIQDEWACGETWEDSPRDYEIDIEDFIRDVEAEYAKGQDYLEDTYDSVEYFKESVEEELKDMLDKYEEEIDHYTYTRDPRDYVPYDKKEYKFSWQNGS